MKPRVLAFALSFSLLALPAVQASDTVKIRLGTLAPRNTAWHQNLLDIGEAWRAAQGRDAQFIVYTDGSQGGEADMVRRMRIGQLNAALLTVVGLAEIDDSVSVLQNMPLVFRSWDELDYVRDKLRPDLERRFLDKGFVVLSWGDAGWVRFFSSQPALRPADYRPMKIFAWAGDAPQADIMKSLGYRPVVLEVADILPALQTGMIDMVPSSPFWALTLQLYPHAPHMLELDWAPLVGAIVVTRRLWEQLSGEGRTALRAGAEASGVRMRALSRREQRESVKAMRKRGLVVHTPSPEVEAEWRAMAESLYPKVRGRMVAPELFDQVMSLLRDYRAMGTSQ